MNNELLAQAIVIFLPLLRVGQDGEHLVEPDHLALGRGLQFGIRLRIGMQ
jgi:hypothetical protein